MRAMRLVGAVALVVCWMAGFAACFAQPETPTGKWSQPAAELAAQIADILGPGQAQIQLRNISTVSSSDIPIIRKLLEQDLKTRGVLAGGAESANTIRVTLSESARERLWVAEIIEGNDSRVAMVHIDSGQTASVSKSSEQVVLRRERIPGLVSHNSGDTVKDNPILAAAEINGRYVVVFADRISAFTRAGNEWTESSTSTIEKKLGRDPRAILVPSSDGGSFASYAPGTECAGTYSLPLIGNSGENAWTIRCHASDDPWPIYQSADASAAPALKAFYNPARDYFTGVVTPKIGPDLPPFYTAGMIPRPAGGAALLLAGIDGKVQIFENGTMRSIAGARDWGSDFAVVRSGCGSDTQVIVSGSGQAVSDSLRAFTIPALEAVPESSALSMDGTVTALWTAQDGRTAMAVVRNSAGEYEVDRVTALCN